MNNYNVDLMLNTFYKDQVKIKNSLLTCSEEATISLILENTDGSFDYSIVAVAQDPTLVFDVCAQFGRMKSVKVNEDTTYKTK